jgi:hypothetical protein
VIGPTVIENPLTKVDPGVSFVKSVGGLTYTMAIRDNTVFAGKFDPGRFQGIVARPTRTIVVGQDPPAGDFVPGGTPVNVTLVMKDEIPLDTFKDIDVIVAQKYKTIGALQADLENPNDPVSTEAKTVLDKNVEYNALSSGDKLAIDNYILQRFGDQAGTEETKAKVYEDVKFFRNI